MNIRNAVVTGGLGFIGSHLAEELASRGSNVTVLDNESTGRRANLGSSRSHSKIRIVNVDVADGSAVQPHLIGADCVFHLAGLADLIPSIEKPADYFHSNVAGTLGILEAARNADVKRFVYTASSSCYGIPTVFPTPEDAPIRPEHPYALTKYLGEHLVLHWGKVYKLRPVSLRLFNVYGPRVRTNGGYGAVLGVFLAQKLHRHPLTIVGDGAQTRDFTHVLDVVNALITAAESDVDGEVFNVGSGRSYPVHYLADLIGGPKLHMPKRPGEPDCTFADISKIRKVLNWSPQISLEEGIGQLLKRLEDWKDAPLWTPKRIEEATATWFQYLSPAAQEVS